MSPQSSGERFTPFSHNYPVIFVVDTDGTITSRWVDGTGDTDFAAGDAIHETVAEPIEGWA